MENLIRYRSEFDELNSQEIKLLEKAAVSVREFIQISKKNKSCFLCYQSCTFQKLCCSTRNITDSPNYS